MSPVEALQRSAFAKLHPGLASGTPVPTYPQAPDEDEQWDNSEVLEGPPEGG